MAHLYFLGTGDYDSADSAAGGGLRYPPGTPGHYLFGQHADWLHDAAGGYESLYCQLPL